MINLIGALLFAIDNAAQAAALPVKLPAVKTFPKNSRIEQAGLELADGLYPIVGSLEAKAVGPLAGRVVTLAATGGRRGRSTHECYEV